MRTGLALFDVESLSMTFSDDPQFSVSQSLLLYSLALFTENVSFRQILCSRSEAASMGSRKLTPFFAEYLVPPLGAILQLGVDRWSRGSDDPFFSDQRINVRHVEWIITNFDLLPIQLGSP